ncbi:hypothetical protein [Pandoraea sputorum]|uniref:hypothetical protein n=1 Tax=Pandoraea sputorum TaxID=93222 RepID=UPI00123FA0BE|nr:hypothetical protein [Pandoraea sputorum]VVE54970.1 hypothetical protein PSP20601_04950 [Pandoraea sputorum]
MVQRSTVSQAESLRCCAEQTIPHVHDLSDDFNNRNNIAEISQLPPPDGVEFRQAFGARAKRVFTLEGLQKTPVEIRDPPRLFLRDLICSHLRDTPGKEDKMRVRHAEVL